MDEHQLKGLFYNCDDKYFPRHKCKEYNLFMVIYEDFYDEDVMFPPLKKYPKKMILLRPLILQ